MVEESDQNTEDSIDRLDQKDDKLVEEHDQNTTSENKYEEEYYTKNSGGEDALSYA